MKNTLLIIHHVSIVFKFIFFFRLQIEYSPAINVNKNKALF